MNPKNITVHCSATRPHQNLTANDIRRMHRKKGYRDIGYHFVIRLDACIESGRACSRQGAHVKGHNDDNIGICLVGGLDVNGKPTHTYSAEQLETLYKLILDVCERYSIPFENVCGHRDWYGDTNNDGVVDRYDWLKECPCFDVREWLNQLLVKDSII